MNDKHYTFLGATLGCLIAYLWHTSKIQEPFAALLGAIVALGLAAIPIFKKERGNSAIKDSDRIRHLIIKRLRSDYSHLILKTETLNLNLQIANDLVSQPNKILAAKQFERGGYIQSNQIYSIFENCDNQILILGEAGAGKTNLINQLAWEAVQFCEEKNNKPVPIIFNLSTWKDKKKIEHWIIEALTSIYSFPQNVAEEWINSNKIIFLLDGFDEIKTSDKPENKFYINEINNFINSNHVEVAITSRKSEYLQLDERFSIRNALEIIDLSNKQVHDYFEKIKRDDVIELFKKNEVVREVIKNPLFVQLLSQIQDVASINLKDNQHVRNKIWQEYLKYTINQKLKEEKKFVQNYSIDKIRLIDWIRTVAIRMADFDTIFFKEKIGLYFNALYLVDKSKGYKRLTASALVTLLSGQFLALAIGCLVGISFGFKDFFVSCIIAGLLYNFLSLFGRVMFRNKIAKFMLGVGLGVVAACAFGMDKQDFWQNFFKITKEIIFPFAIVVIVIGETFSAPHPYKNQTKRQRSLDFIVVGLIYFLVLSIFFLIIYGISLLILGNHGISFSGQLIIGFTLTLLNILLSLNVDVLYFKKPPIPLTQIINKVISTLLVGSLLLFCLTLFKKPLTLINIKGSSLFDIVSFAIIFMTIIFSYINGFFLLVGYFTTHVFFLLTGMMPFRFTEFIDLICRLGIIQRAGNGYRFYHAELQSYLESDDEIKL